MNMGLACSKMLLQFPFYFILLNVPPVLCLGGWHRASCWSNFDLALSGCAPGACALGSCVRASKSWWSLSLWLGGVTTKLASTLPYAGELSICISAGTRAKVRREPGRTVKETGGVSAWEVSSVNNPLYYRTAPAYGTNTWWSNSICLGYVLQVCVLQHLSAWNGNDVLAEQSAAVCSTAVLPWEAEKSSVLPRADCSIPAWDLEAWLGEFAVYLGLSEPWRVFFIYSKIRGEAELRVSFQGQPLFI